MRNQCVSFVFSGTMGNIALAIASPTLSAASTRCVCIGKVGVARRGAVPAVAEQLANERKILARHEGLAGRGVAQVVEA